MSEISYDLVEMDGVLMLTIFRRQPDPVQPAFYYYPDEKRIVLERQANEKHSIQLTEQAAIDRFNSEESIMVVEVDRDNDENMLSYDLVIQKIVE